MTRSNSYRAISLLISLVMLITIFRLPSYRANAAVSALWPLPSNFKTITTHFDSRRNSGQENTSYHNAMDISATSGTNIYAVYDGTVEFSGWKDSYGNLVVLYHPALGVYTFYAHASSLIAKQGATVKQGDIIAKVGSTGNSSGPHLHFGICNKVENGWPRRTYYDPETYFTYTNSSGSTPTTEKKWYNDYDPVNLGDSFYAHIENYGKKVLLSSINLNVQGAEPIGTDNQIWKFTRQSDGSYSIISYDDGYSMDVSDYKDEAGTNIQMMPYVGNTAQRFFIYKINGFFFFRPVFADNVFDMDQGSYNLAIWNYDPSYVSKQFEINKVDLDGNMPVNLGADFSAQIICKQDTSLLISNVDNNVKGATPNGSKNQVWHFIRQDDGTYGIFSYENGYSMDVSDYKNETGTNIQMMPFVANSAQRFFIYNINGSYYFKPLFSDYVLDMDASSYNVATWGFDTTSKVKQFEINKVSLTNTVTFDANGGILSTKSKSVEFGKKYGTLPTPTKSNTDFLGWYTAKTGGTKITEDMEVIITASQTLFAHWSSPKIYTVKFNSNGGSGTMSNLTMTYDTAKNLTANAFKRDGYTFLGWSTDKAATKATYTDKQSVKNLTATANGTVTLYAVWSDKTAPKITKAAAESVSMTGFKITATVSDAAGLKSVTANVNSWRGFDTDGKSITLKQSNGIWTADVKISDFNTTYGAYYFTVIATDTNGNVAKSDSVEVKIGISTCTFDPNGGKVDPASKTLVYGEKYSRLAKLPTPSRTGYIFDGWYTAKTGGTKITDDTVVTETKDHTLYAHWTAKTIKVTFHHNRNSNDTNTVTETFIYGVSNQKFGYMTDGTGKYKKMNDPAVGFGEWTNPGYTLLGWNTDKTATAQLYSTYNTVGNDWINQKSPSIDLYAVWKANSYAVTFNANGGTVDPANKKVSYNASYGDLPSPTWKGHLFQGWFTAKEGGTQVTKDTKYTLTADQTLYAQWKLNGYSVKFDAAGGTVSTASIHVTYSKAYGTLPTPEFKGYRFVGWFTEEGTEVTDKTTVTINHDHTLTAHWKLNVPENLELRNGDQYQLDMPDEVLTYRSNNANVAVVSKSGIITAVGKGKAIITVLDAEDNAYQVKLTVLPVMLQGDINLDGQVNIADAILLQKWLLAVPDTKLPDWRAGDLYADNRLDVFDLCLLKRMLIYG